MISARISFQHKRILIVGGGKQAWRKGKKFLDEGASVMFLAPTFLEDIPKELRKEAIYHKDVLKQVDLVYACTNDCKVNDQVVEDANAQGITSASIHQSDQATLHLLHEKDFEHLHIALSTKGASPAFAKNIMEDMKHQYEEGYHRILSQLHFIRQYVLEHCAEEEQRTTFLKELAVKDETWISFLYQSIQQKHANILCFHGNEEPSTLQILHSFIEPFQEATSVAYLKEGNHIKSIKTIKSIMNDLKIPTTYFIVTLEEGRIYHKMKEQLEGETIVSCCLHEEDISSFMQMYQNKKVLFVVHESKSKFLVTKMKQSARSHMYAMELHDDIVKQSPDSIYVVPLMLLKGKHFKNDVLSSDGLYGKLSKLYKQVEIENQCLLENEWYCEILRKKMGIR